MENLVMESSFWQNRKVLITGHTGFKGGWLSLWLQKIGCNVIGVSLDPPTSPNLYQQANIKHGMVSLRADIRNLTDIKTIFQEHQPEVVFHLAAQPLVRQSYIDPIETYQTNVMGTLNILESMRAIKSVRSAVMVTTDKCYDNKEWVWGYRENEPMGGYDPYSSSKGCAELLIASYRHSYFSKQGSDNTAIATVRAGNVIGGGDWADDRLIPDIIRAFQKGSTVQIRNPNSVRPWQHVLEPLAGYLTLARKLFDNGNQYAQAWNFGPSDNDVKPVQWIVEKMSDYWNGEALWAVDDGDHPHEANYLKLDCSKARSNLLWEPKWNLEYSLKKIIEWHKAAIQGEDLQKLSLTQIESYMNDT